MSIEIGDSDLPLDRRNFSKVGRVIEMNKPGYVRFGEYVDEEMGPIECADLQIYATSFEGLLGNIRVKVQSDWYGVVEGRIKTYFDDWKKSYPKSYKFRKNKPNPLLNCDYVLEKLKIGDFDDLAGLRSFMPDAWKAILVSLSVREKRILETGRDYINNLSESDERLANFGMNKYELQLLFNMSVDFQSNTDFAFLKQLNLTELKGGKSADDHTGVDGMDYIYTFRNSKGTEHMAPLGGVFEREFDKLSEDLTFYSELIRKQLDEGKLPETYAKLSGYLLKLSKFLGNKDGNSESVIAMRDELDREILDVCEAGCPLIITLASAGSITEDAQKVDVGINISVRTPRLQKLQEKMMSGYDASLQDTASTYEGNLLGVNPYPGKGYFVYGFSKTGSDIYWGVIGAADTYTSFTNIDELNRKSHGEYETVLALMEKPCTYEEYLEACIFTTYAHETGGHQLVNIVHPEISDAIGKSVNIEKFDEIKADTVDLIAYLKLYQKGQANVSPEAIVQVLINWYAKYLEGSKVTGAKEFDRYTFSGNVIAMTLLESGAIEINNGKIQIVNAINGINALSSLGEEIIDVCIGQEAELNSNRIDGFVKKLVKKYTKYEKLDEYKNFVKSKLKF